VRVASVPTPRWTDATRTQLTALVRAGTQRLSESLGYRGAMAASGA